MTQQRDTDAGEFVLTPDDEAARELLKLKIALEHTRGAYEALFDGQDALAAYYLRYALEAQLAFDESREMNCDGLGYNMPQHDESLVGPALARFAAAGVTKRDELLLRAPIPDRYPESLKKLFEKDGLRDR